MKRCAFCGSKKTYISVTELEHSKVTETFNMCYDCGAEYMKEVEKDLHPQSAKKEVDLTHVQTPLQLLNLINAICRKPISTKEPCPNCGLSPSDFQLHGKFGCAQCYEHFQEEFETLAIPYHHGAEEHVGKRPKHAFQKSMEAPEEKRKVLKLRLAQAVELENYELAAKYRDELNAIQGPPS